MDETSVVLFRSGRAGYPKRPPFDPSERYPEYPSAWPLAQEENPAYAAVRGALLAAGLDERRAGTPDWNPLGAFMGPGQLVVLKPNLIKEDHPRDPDGWVYTLTHGSIIRAVADYVYRALEGRGRVLLADAPQTDASFDRIVALLGLDVLRRFYRDRGLSFEIADLRREEWENREGVIVARRPRPGDPAGYVAFDLGDNSELAEHGGGGRYYGADYDEGEVNRHHADGRHEYLISGSVVHCDVLVNLPKLKTHKKTGITVNLKNLVGVNGDKNWLPHHTAGFPKNGGDQYPRATLRRRIEHHATRLLRRAAIRSPRIGTWLFRRARRVGTGLFGDTAHVVRSGNWHGNDTAWRMCLDLNKVVLYGNPDGRLRPPDPSNRKRYLSFVDGLIAGQGNGPIDPDPINAGVLLFGTNPVSVDVVAAVLMGFDPEAIPLTRHAFRPRGYPLTPSGPGSIRCLGNHPSWRGTLEDLRRAPDLFSFRPHFGWTGRIERSPR